MTGNTLEFASAQKLIGLLGFKLVPLAVFVNCWHIRCDWHEPVIINKAACEIFCIGAMSGARRAALERAAQSHA